jgi:hypothetical protein
MPADAGEAAGGLPWNARFTIRGYEPGDEAAILELFARSFPHAPRTLPHWRWKFEDDPYGREHISLAFDDAQRLVGHYAGYPVAFVDDGRELVGHQVGDTMTDVAVRHIGRGPSSILGRTALDFYSRFCQDRVAFNYGFNVANIQRFSLRFLRSDRVEPVTYRIRDVRARPFTRMPRLARWTGGWSVGLVYGIGREFDAFFERVAPSYHFLVRRDARYLRWRYFDCPDIHYFMVGVWRSRELAGWSVFRIRENRLVWGDALFDSQQPEAIEVLLRQVVPQYPVDAIEGWFPPRPGWFDAALTRLGFEARPEPQDLSLMCVPFTFGDAAAMMRHRLYYTWGDSDLF